MWSRATEQDQPTRWRLWVMYIQGHKIRAREPAENLRLDLSTIES